MQGTRTQRTPTHPTYKHSGTSNQGPSNQLYPIIAACEWTVWEPVEDVATLAVGEIVFAEPSEGRLLVSVIHGIDIHGWGLGDMSDPPRMYGYCEAEGIYGRLTDVFD